MKRILKFGFLLMGFSFTVTQGLLIRELLVAFFGNELSIGLILGNWLILEAVGSGLLGKLADRWRGKASSFAALQVLFALFLPLCLYAAYTSRRIVGAIPGEGVGLIPIFTSSFLILTPLALVDGAMFAFGCRAYATLTGNEAPSIGWVYVYEALGAIAGGIVFTYLFIPFLYSLQIVLLLSALNLLSAALVLAFQTSEVLETSEVSLPKGKRLPLTPGLIVVLVLLSTNLGFLLCPQVEEVQRWATSQQWVGYNLVYSENSVYGNVAVVQREAQYTFYADGIPILTAPVPDVALTEEIVHLPMLFIPQPQRALVLSGGVGGVLRELAKYPLKRIDYAELDPLLIEAVLKFPTPLTLSELSDPRVRVEHVDGRLLVRRKEWGMAPQTKEGYDLVIVNLPYPSTLQLNRFYTVEFFQMVRGLLAEEGILVIGCPGTLTYMSDELRHLNTMAYHTLQGAFSYVRPIPGDVTLWLASPSDELSTVPVEALVERWEERGLETQLLTAPHIRLRLGQRRLDWFWTSLGEEENGGRAVVNRDLHPMGLFYGLSYWNALFSPHLARVFAFAGRLNLWTLSLPLLGCALLFLTVVKLTAKGRGACPEPVLSAVEGLVLSPSTTLRINSVEGRSRRAIVPVVIATTGFTGMTADLIIVFAFQTLYGYVYHWIGLLITAFMAGLSLGGLLMTRRLATIGNRVSSKSGARHLQSNSGARISTGNDSSKLLRPLRKCLAPYEKFTLLKLELAILLYWALLPIALSTLYARIPHPLVFTSIQGILLFLNALAGFLVGSQFPLANRMWLKGREDLRGTAGVLYACDLVGAFLGSIVVSVILIPVLGILETCLLAATLKLGSLLLVAALPSPSPNPLPLPKFGRGRGSPKGGGG